MTVGFVHHASVDDHDAGAGHPERADRVRAIVAGLDASGLLASVEQHAPEPATREVLELVHAPDYLDLLERVDEAGGARLDPDTRMGPGSLEAALRGSAGACDAVDAVADGRWDAAFVCMRPPGHHAPSDQAMGFCLTNHVAVAARWAVASERARRVAIVDWDAHHGNGTQDIFYDDPSVLYVSLHQYPFYPGTGALRERGAGDAEGTTVNVPLPAGTGDDGYTRAFDEVVVPALEAFGPDVVLVSAGYDAHRADPLCMMGLLAGAYHRFARQLAGHGRGPVCVLEGGYDLDALAWSSNATVSALLGRDPVGVPDAELGRPDGTDEAHAWIDAAVAAHASSGRPVRADTPTEK